MPVITPAMRQKSREVRMRQAFERAERFPSKRIAYRKGYAQGYLRAYRWWKAKYERDVKRSAA